MKILISFIFSILLITDAHAFKASAFTMIGYGSYEEKAGAEFSLGLQLRPVEWVKLDIAPMTGIFRRKNDPRYSRVKDDDKQLNCRDNTTGQYVDSKYCGITFEYAFESSLKVQPFKFFEIGVGARVADRTLVYGVALFKFTDHFGLEGKFGDDYHSALFRVDF